MGERVTWKRRGKISQMVIPLILTRAPSNSDQGSNKRSRHNMVRNGKRAPEKAKTDRHTKVYHSNITTDLRGKRRLRHRVVNVLGKGKVLIDSGSSYNVVQLPKNLPGQAVKARVDEYNLLTADRERLVVTHYSEVNTIGESVCTNTDCPILSPVQLLRTGHRFEGHGSEIKITSKHGVVALGELTENSEFVITKEEMSKLLVERVGRVRGAREDAEESSVDDSEEQDIEAVILPAVNQEENEELDGDYDNEDGNLSQKVTSNKSYSKEQRWRALQVKYLLKFAHMSNSTLKRALDTGVFAGTALTSADVDVYIDIYGPCSSCICGKLTRPSYRKPSDTAPTVRTGQHLWGDLWPFDEIVVGVFNNYIIGIDEHSDYGTALPIDTKHTPKVLNGLLGMVSMYGRHGHTVEKIVTDSENTFRACEVELGMRGIELTHTPPYQHAQRVERFVRTVKDRMRTMLAAMLTELPLNLYGYLLEAAMEIMNHMPTSKHQLATPAMMVSGNKLDIGRQRLIPFGTVAMMHAQGRGKGGLGPRADLGVVLGPCRNTTGTYNCWNLHTDLVVQRKSLTVLPVLPRPFPWVV
jgi:hypothetical protein